MQAINNSVFRASVCPDRQARSGQIDSGQIDFMDELAKMFAKFLDYGREINDCKTVRAQNLYGFGMLEEDWLPWLLGTRVGLLVFCKIALYVVIGFTIGSRL